MARLEHQNRVAGAERIDERGLPGASSRGGKNDYRAVAFEYRFHAVQALGRQIAEFRAAMIHRRIVHRPQDSVGDIGRPWDLQKMSARFARWPVRPRTGHSLLPFGQATASANCMIAGIQELDLEPVHEFRFAQN